MIKRMGLTLLLLLVAIQLYRPARTNPPANPRKSLQERVDLPPATAALLERSCSDCHSHRTRWPWYSQVAPASWILASHVREARRHLNFSEWGAYDRVQAAHHLEEMCEEVSEREMPLPSYLLLHRAARLSDAEIKTVCDWTREARKALGTSAGEEAEEAAGR